MDVFLLKIFLLEWGYHKLMTLMIVHEQKEMVENDCNGLRALEFGKTF